MNSITKQDLEDFVGRVERSVAESRASLSPAIVSQLVSDIRDIRDKTAVIPTLTERIGNIKVESDKIDGIDKRVAIVETVQARTVATIDNAFKWIWGLVTGVIMLGFGILFK